MPSIGVLEAGSEVATSSPEKNFDFFDTAVVTVDGQDVVSDR